MRRTCLPLRAGPPAFTLLCQRGLGAGRGERALRSPSLEGSQGPAPLERNPSRLFVLDEHSQRYKQQQQRSPPRAAVGLAHPRGPGAPSSAETSMPVAHMSRLPATAPPECAAGEPLPHPCWEHPSPGACTGWEGKGRGSARTLRSSAWRGERLSQLADLFRNNAGMERGPWGPPASAASNSVSPSTAWPGTGLLINVPTL